MTTRTRARRVIAGILPALLLASSAYAFQPDGLPERAVELDGSQRVRLVTPVSSATPARARAAFDVLLARHGDWQAIWDLDRGVPQTLWGEGIHVRGATDDAAIAEEAAREVLGEQLALLAPGARAGDFQVSRNFLRAGIRTVWFRQYHDGLPVVGAEVGFSFKLDRLVVMRSTAVPDLTIAAPAAPVAADLAARRATAWIDGIYGASSSVLSTGGAEVLQLRLDSGGVSTHVAVPVVVDQQAPRAQWTVWVDASTGQPVARRQRQLFGSGTVSYRVPPRHPDGGYASYPAAFATHDVDGGDVVSSGTGTFDWVGNANATVSPGLTGPYASIINQEGALATTTLDVADGGSATWDASSEEKIDAQLTAFIHANIAKQYALANIDPDLPWLSQSILVYVNEGATCNAYSMLDDIHFYVAGPYPPYWDCGNTARIGDVMYHEFGHSLHGQSSGLTLNDWNYEIGTLSEGISDYYSATIVDDSRMGLGFFADDLHDPLRHIDQPNDRVYPDDTSGEVHWDGEIIAGTLWDLREALSADLGDAAGVALADDIFYGVIVNARSITAAFAEALLVDDDNGNLGDGTPNFCTIRGVFDAHGLAGGVGTPLSAIQAPTFDGTSISVPKIDAVDRGDGCPSVGIGDVTLVWRTQSGDGEWNELPFDEGADTYTAELPLEAWGEAIDYAVSVNTTTGVSKGFPTTRFDPYYQAVVGDIEEIVCADFETDPGWTLSNFNIGTPAGGVDPPAAFEGTGVLGTAVGGGGNYAPGTIGTATSPVLAVGDHDKVHLMYRRWNTAPLLWYDQTRVYIDGVKRWQQSFEVLHADTEWRQVVFDVSADAADGNLEIQFDLGYAGFSDGGSYGGWNVDDLCVVTVGPPPPPPEECGNGEMEGAEECDDGNVEDGDGCSATCQDEDEPPVDDDDGGGCCSTGRDGGAGWLLLGLGTFALVRRRRRR
jgi:MYXO-CTERM domain-containing protein